MKVCVCKLSEHDKICFWEKQHYDNVRFQQKGKYAEMRTLQELADYLDSAPDRVFVDRVLISRPFSLNNYPCEAELCIRVCDDYLEYAE